MRVSILDLGSNSFRLLVADVSSDGAIHPVLREREFLRLGSEVAATGSLTDDVIERAVGAAGHLAGLGLRSGAERSMAVATSAIRDAVNSENVVDRLQEAAGIPIRVIEGQEEARLGFLGVASSIAFPEGTHLVLDLGGGSLELAIGSGASPIWTESMDLGASRLWAKCVTSDPLSDEDVGRLQERVRSTLEPVLPRVQELDPNWCVSIGGPNRALVELALGRASPWRPATLNQTWVTRAELTALRDRMVPMSLRERVAMQGMKRARAEQLPTAAVIVATVLDLLNVSRTVVSNWGLREGAILDVYGDSSLAFGRQLRLVSVSRMERRFSPHAVHDAHVEALATSLFDQLSSIHRMPGVAPRAALLCNPPAHDWYGCGFPGIPPSRRLPRRKLPAARVRAIGDRHARLYRQIQQTGKYPPEIRPVSEPRCRTPAVGSRTHRDPAPGRCRRPWSRPVGPFN